MNIYRHQFVCHCPANNKAIIYDLCIESDAMIHVEHIVTAAALHQKGYHESIADDLQKRLGGRQVLNRERADLRNHGVAHHGDVAAAAQDPCLQGCEEGASQGLQVAPVTGAQHGYVGVPGQGCDQALRDDPMGVDHVRPPIAYRGAQRARKRH